MIPTGTDLLPQIIKDPAKVDEVEIFLQQHFGGAAQIEPRKVRYGDQIEFTYTKRGDKINQIVSIRDLCTDVFSHLQNELDQAVYVDHGAAVNERYFFTSREVIGSLRIGDELQIVPASEHAPRPEVLLADHPAILVFRSKSSPHWLINQHRQAKRGRELLLLLTVLVRGGISWISNTVQNNWVWDIRGNDPRDYSFAYRQIGYFPNIEWEHRDGAEFFVNPDWPEIPRKEHSRYYGDSGFTVGEPFQLPDSFEASFGRYHQLADEEASLFLRSAYWLAKSSEVFGQSHSMAYVALVYALEGLVPDAAMIGQCEGCGRDQFDKSISARLREFLEEYGAGLAKANIDEIYGLRSAIAHGGGLLPQDREITGFRFTAEQNEKAAVFRELSRICEVVLINWLHSDSRK